MSLSFIITTAVYVVVVGIILWWLSSCVVVVSEKTAKLIERFGKYSSTKQAGLNFKLPWPIDAVRATVPLNTQELKDTVVVKSSDNAFLEVPWSIQYIVIGGKAKEAYYELDDPRKQMKSYVTNTIRSAATDMVMNDLFKSKDAFERAVSEGLTDIFASNGYEIINVLVDDPQPSAELKKAFDKVLASERDKEAARNRAEAKRIEMVGEASAEGESLVIKAESFKKFRVEIAEGNAKAITEFLKDTEGLVAKDVLDFFNGVDLRDAIRDASKNPGSIIVVPVGYGNDSNIGQIAATVRSMTQ